MTTQISNCCDAPIRLSNPKARRGQTVYWICTKCENPCDEKSSDLPLSLICPICRRSFTKVLCSKMLCPCGNTWLLKTGWKIDRTELFEGEKSSLYQTYQDATKPDWTPINMKNEPRLSAEIEKRFDEEISYLLHETVDGDWCPALGIPYFNPLGSTSATKSKPNYRIINPIYKCECGGDEKIAKVKHFLATALESQTAEYVRKIKTMRVVAHGLGFLLDKDEVLDVLTQKKEDR